MRLEKKNKYNKRLSFLIHLSFIILLFLECVRALLFNLSHWLNLILTHRPHIHTYVHTHAVFTNFYHRKTYKYMRVQLQNSKHSLFKNRCRTSCFTHSKDAPLKTIAETENQKWFRVISCFELGLFVVLLRPRNKEGKYLKALDNFFCPVACFLSFFFSSQQKYNLVEFLFKLFFVICILRKYNVCLVFVVRIQCWNLWKIRDWYELPYECFIAKIAGFSDCQKQWFSAN